jgi:8-oxo-dGTP pyrophosphatase MutT (NUDIX family)
MGTETPRTVHRLSARLLILDERDRLLLFFSSGYIGPGIEYFVTVGGGVDEGESLQEAAAREAYEETGLRVDPADLGPVVAHAEGAWQPRPDLRLYQDDHYFFLRAQHFDVDWSHLEEIERDEFSSAEWLTLAQLEAVDHAVFPVGVAAVVKRLVAGDIPTTPVELPWIEWTGYDKHCPIPPA